MPIRVVLVNPPLSGQARYGKLASAGVYMPHLGLGFLASQLRKNGFEVKILDCEALKFDIDKTVEHIFYFNPHFIGITAVTMSINSAAELAKHIKIINKKIPIIIGGPHLAAAASDTMDLFPQFDLGVIGEAELSLVDLLKAVGENKDLKNVKGIIFRDNGALYRTAPRPLVEDLDVLPFPAWDLYPDLKKYYRPSVFGFKKLPCTSLITARGCPGQCSFCNQGVWGKRYREHSSGYVMDMIKILFHKYGIRDLAVYDGTFGVNKRRLIELCEMLVREKLNLVWSCNLRLEMANPDILSLMKKAGCWGIAYGIESCAQEVLDFMQKDIDMEMLARALKFTRQAGIISKGYIMVGTLAETPASINKTLEEVMKLDLDLLTVNSFTPFPGTLDYERADKYGQFNKDWTLLNEHNFVFVPRGFTQEQLEYFTQLITRRFYLRPRVFLKYIKMSFNLAHFKLLFIGFITLLKFSVRNPFRKKETSHFN